MDARFKNFQLERKKECMTAEYLWRTTVFLIIPTLKEAFRFVSKQHINSDEKHFLIAYKSVKVVEETVISIHLMKAIPN